MAERRKARVMLSTHRQMTPENIAGCIERDPASWSGISLLFIQLPDGKLPGAIEPVIDQHPDALVMYGRMDDCIVLGAGLPQDAAFKKARACFWIHDVAQQAVQACAILRALAAQAALPATLPAIPSVYGVQPAILIVEDDPMTSKMVARHLQRFATVKVTKNAREAIANHTVQDPDIIFLDIHYKDDAYDGFDVLQNILGADAAAFVVMFSADRKPATIARALSLGARGFIAKPFRAEHFTHYLGKLVSAGLRA